MKKNDDKRSPSPETQEIPPICPPLDRGLSSAQVQQRRSAGLQNISPKSNTKTPGQIIRENTLTFFNLIFLIMALILLFSGSSLKNLTFLGVAVCNTVIGVLQELRAKRAVDKLTLIAAGSLPVLRDGKTYPIRTDLLVRDDLVTLAAGDQICADALVRDGELKVNESLLTGEADAITKQPGDTLKSGSFVISGRCLAQLTAVGAQSYAAQLSAEARQNTASTKSEMMRALTRLIRVVGIALIPMGVILFLRQLQTMDFTASAESTVAALIGMIPEGLYLLTSVAIAVSCLKLSGKRVLVQDMNCIETLARVDVLCVDKTGTITEPVMEVSDIAPLDSENYSHELIEEILAAFYDGREAENETARAMAQQFARPSDWSCVKRLEFSSATKFSAADFGENGCYVMGAPEILMGEHFDRIRQQAEFWSERGCRVLLLAAYGQELSDVLNADLVSPVALILLSNRVRKDAPDTFRYFARQGVSIKVISGDNPLTVSRIAANAGIENAESYVDASTLRGFKECREAVEKYTVFGRVTPEQKRYFVQALRELGHTVAMTGDGVNDVLALKDADCGVAMASGAQAASQISQIVLLDSNFSAMPGIVAEGRRVINNIQRAASLFLVKNIFSFGLTFLLLFIDFSYPLQPIQLSLISTLTIGIPAFFLALEPNYAIVKGKFMRNVIRRAMPGGLTNICLVLIAALFVHLFDLPATDLETISVWILATVGFVTLFHISRPFTKLRIAVFSLTLGAMAVCLLFMPGFFELHSLCPQSIVLLVLLLLACPTVMHLFLLLLDRGMLRRDHRMSS